MFYIQFLKPFLILKIFLQNLNFLGPWAHFLRKLKIFSFFENIMWGHVAHVLYPIFEALLNFEIFFLKIFMFWPLGSVFEKTQNYGF